MSAAAAPREWIAASDLAGLPGLAASKRGVLMQAQAGGWRSRETVGRGGKRLEFHITALPAQARAALVFGRANVVVGGTAVGADVVQAQAVATAQALGMAEAQRSQLTQDLSRRAAELAQQQGLRAAATLDAKQQRRMDARLAVLAQVQQFAAAAGLAPTVAEQQYALAWRTGNGGVPDWVRAELGSLSASSLQRWRLQVKGGGVARLAGDYGNRRGATKVAADPQVQAFVLAMMTSHPHARATQVHAALRARMRAQIDAGEVDLPSVRSLERWMDGWRQSNAEVATALSNPDAWKGRYMVAFGSQSEGVLRINQRWEMDTTPADVMLTDGRHTVLGVVDVFTRRARLLVSRTSTAVAVCGLLRATLLDWGVPEQVKTDNGSDYTSRHLVRVLQGLEIDHTLCPPFQPWHKPHIERFFGTFARDLVELLPGYIGHSVAERSAIESRHSFAERLMTRGEVLNISLDATALQAFCDRWVADVYHHNPHEGLDRSTPWQVTAANRQAVRVISDERALDVLLAEAPDNGGRRTVGKKGIRYDGVEFIAPELERLVGRNVLVRYDALDDDLGRLYVFDEAGFVCIAECPERTGMSRREVAAKAKELQKTRVQEQRAALRAAARKVGTDTVVEEILTTRAQDAGKLARLPRQGTVQHQSAGLDAAAAAVAAATTPQATSAAVLQLGGVADTWARLQAETAADQAGVPMGQDNPLARRRAAASGTGTVATPQFDSRHARAQWLLQQQHTRALTPEERETLALYRKDYAASYQRMHQAAAELFGSGGAKEIDPGRANGTGSV
ncbi:MAG: DDE-type integrase/transposase/recombinase [Burkholderiales bacterium]|nr:DDE-type integrase/transposase/recombinase [Burkholderiales bacterium]